MKRSLRNALTVAFTSGLFLSSLALAAPIAGSITAIDKGMATVRTNDGKDHQIKAIDSFKVGAKVECESKNNVMECRSATPTAAVQPQGQQPAASQGQQPAASQVQQPAPAQKSN